MDAAELWRVKVAVLHVNDDPNKVPLDGDLLVPYLNDRGRAGMVTSGSRQPFLHQLSSSSPGLLERVVCFCGTNPLGGNEPVSFSTKAQPWT